VCCIAIFALAFRLAAPPSGLPVNHNGLLGAAGANQLFPRLSQEREKWLTAIIILSAPLAFGGVSFLRGFLNDALRLRPLGFIAQTLMGALILTAALLGHNQQPGLPGDYFASEIDARALAIALVTAIWIANARLNANRLSAFQLVTKWLTIVAGAFLIAYLVLATVQSPASIRDRTDVAYALDDLLAPANGLHSVGENLPRYSALLGEVIIPAQRIGADPVASAFVFLAVMNGLLLCATYATFRMAGAGPILSLFGMTFAFISTIFFRPLFAGTVGGKSIFIYLNAFDYAQLMPIRYFFPFAIGLIVVAWAHRSQTWLLSSLGFAIGLAAVNDPTFGIASGAVAIATMLCLRLNGGIGFGRRLGDFGYVASGIGAAVAVVCAFSLLIGHGLPRIESLTNATRLYASTGILMYPVRLAWNMQVAPYLIFLSTFALTGAVRASRIRKDCDALHAALFYFSMLGFVAYIYYLNRPVPSTLEESTFYLMGLCLTLVLIFVRRYSIPWARSPMLAAAAIVSVTLLFHAAAIWTFPDEYLRFSKGYDRPPSMTMDFGRYNSLGPEVERFVQSHPAARDVMIVDRVNGRILALQNHMHDLNPAFPDISFDEEVSRFVEVAIKHGCPPIFETSFTPPALASRLSALGYKPVASSRAISLDEVAGGACPKVAASSSAPIVPRTIAPDP
jgi:hypothetical protein